MIGDGVMSTIRSTPLYEADSSYAVLRLLVTIVLMVIGACGMYTIPVVLPSVEAEFGVARADASLPYTISMLGFGVGGVLMGRLADRFGIMVPLLIGAAGMLAGFFLAAYAPNIWVFTLAHGLLISLLGSASTFSPLMADTTMWFAKRRGIAVAICASGNYLGGALWSPVVEHYVSEVGWRQTYMGMGVFCCVVMVGMALCMRARPPAPVVMASKAGAPIPSERPFGLPTKTAQGLICVAGVSCCVAMAMPQVHIVAYCGGLGYGAARGAEMLSLMLASGIISRIVSGVICDKIGGMKTLLLGSALQTLAIALFLPFDGMASLYVISILFGLSQGGIVPAYAIIVREYFPATGVGARIGVVITSTLLGMALGGWLSGKIFDVTGSYQMAFVNGMAWNVLNFSIMFYLWKRATSLSERNGVLQSA
jgi:MFS family permease